MIDQLHAQPLENLFPFDRTDYQLTFGLYVCSVVCFLSSKVDTLAMITVARACMEHHPCRIKQ
jgi:hypothetical protein